MTALAIGISCLLWLGLGLVAGRRQLREGGGSTGQLVGAAAFVALLGGLPLVACALVFPPGELLWSRPGLVLLCAVPAGGYGLLALLRPVRLRGTTDPLPPVEDPAVVDRVAALSRALGVRAPRLLRLYTAGGALRGLACAGGLPAPTVVVSEAVLTGLTAGERDAILAHELAHIANRSLWAIASVGSIAMTLGVLALPRIGEGLVALFGLTIWVGLAALIQRPFEVACDLSAARLVGFAVTSNALDRVHVAVPFTGRGLLGVLAYSTTRHPALAVRRHALWRQAPPDQRQHIADPGTQWLRFRLGACAACAVWLAVLASVLVSARGVDIAANPETLAMLAVLVAPSWTLQLAARLPRRRLARRFRGAALPGGATRITAVLSLPVWVLPWLLIPDRATGQVVMLASFLGWVLFVVLLYRRGQRTMAARRTVGAALARGDFERAWQLGRNREDLLAVDAFLAADLALAAAVTGRRDAAVELFESVVARRRPIPMALLAYSAFLLGSDPGRSAELTTQAATLLADDPMAQASLAMALRALGRQAEAVVAADSGLGMDPDDAGCLATRALLHQDAGEAEAADQCLAAAEAQSMGDPFVVLARAEVLAARSDPAAPDAIRRAVSVISGDPLCLLGDRAAELAASVSLPSANLCPSASLRLEP